MTFFRTFLESHKIQMRARLSRSSSKNGIVERNNGTFKMILDLLSKEKTEALHATLLSRVSLMANLFHGNAVLSAFQLARGYSPSISGVPSGTIPQELLDAHV